MIIDISEQGLTLDGTAGWPQVLAVTFLLLALIFAALQIRAGGKGLLSRLDLPDTGGLRALAVAAVWLAPLWAALFAVVVIALFRIVITLPDFGDGDSTNLRWHVLALVGLVTTLGGLLSFPIALIRVKWSQKTGQLAKVYPKPLKGYEHGEAPEFYRSV